MEHLGDKIVQEKGSLQEIKAKKAALKNVDAVSVKSAVLDSSNVVVGKTEFEDIKALAKKQIIHESEEKKLAEDNKKLAVQVQELQRENQQLKVFKEKVLLFIEKLGLKQQFDKFMKGNVEKEK